MLVCDFHKFEENENWFPMWNTRPISWGAMLILSFLVSVLFLPETGKPHLVEKSEEGISYSPNEFWNFK